MAFERNSASILRCCPGSANFIAPPGHVDRFFLQRRAGDYFASVGLLRLRFGLDW